MSEFHHELRYFRWRTAIRRPIWAFDRHWYQMLGALYLHGHPKLRNAPESSEANFGEVKPDGG